MTKEQAKEYDKSYHPPETIRLDYCAAVLAVVLKHHPEAKELYENIKDCVLLPGVQETFSTVERKIPESDKLLKGMVKKAGYKKNSKPDEKRLVSLTQTKENIDKMVDMEANLKELCARIVPDIDSCANQDKKDAYTYLDLKVKATPDGADIKGYLDPSVIKSSSCLLTTGQTSG